MIRIGLLAMSLAALVAGTAEAGTFTVFRVPGSKASMANAINASGMVTGEYVDKTSTQPTSGFIRMTDGTFATFSVPGYDVVQPLAINRGGAVAGIAWNRGTNSFAGFVRTQDGVVSAIAVPGAAITRAFAINASGTVVGYYIQPDGHTTGGFVRAPDGMLTLAGIPGPVFAINDEGTIGGAASDGSGAFLMHKDGSVVSFQGGENVFALDNKEWATGIFPAHSQFHGYLRRPNGHLREFGPPSLGFESGCINRRGDVSGHYRDSNQIDHGFVFSAKGEFSAIDAPDAGHVRRGSGTTVTCGNDDGVLSGFYYGDAGNAWAFIYTP